MLLIDFSQLAISSIITQIGSNADLSENLIRHIILNSILSYKKRFGEEYGEIVFCADSRKYWRKDVFPYYKGNRKKMRERSPLNWDFIFDTLSKVKNELRENFPYKFIEIEKAEADDIIATLCKMSQSRTHDIGLFGETEPVLILSGDKDFVQLQKYSNVAQYSPMQKKFLRTDDPRKELKEKILHGDPGDGVPNFLSDDDVFMVENKRQKPLRAKLVAECLKKEPEQFCDATQLKNYKRNELVINLANVPDYIEKAVIEAYEKEPIGKRSGIFGYFMKFKLKHLTEELPYF
jgi:5'-3' exonuclease